LGLSVKGGARENGKKSAGWGEVMGRGQRIGERERTKVRERTLHRNIQKKYLMDQHHPVKVREKGRESRKNLTRSTCPLVSGDPS